MMSGMTRSESGAGSRIHRLRARLLQRIARQYQTVTQQIRLAAGETSLDIEFTRITDPDAVLDLVADDEARREKLRGSRLPADHLEPAVEPRVDARGAAPLADDAA